MRILDNINDFTIESICAAGVFQNEKPDGFLSGFYDRIEVIFVNSGKLTVTSGGKCYECTAGSAALFKSGEIHYIKLLANEYTEYLFVSFSLSKGAKFNFDSKIIALSVLQKQLVLNICNRILESGAYNTTIPTVFMDDSLEALRLASTLKLLMVDMTSNEKELMPLITRDAVLLQNAVNEMEYKVLEQLSLEALANKLDISLSHLKRIFAYFTDVGVHEYFMCLKICKAIEMLKSGMSVTETAEKTGFNNQNYFSAAFKRIVGISPKEYCTVKKKITSQRVVVTSVKSNSVPEKKPASDMPSYLL